MSQNEFAIIGIILRPFGIKGDLIIRTVDDRCLFEHIKDVFYYSKDGITSIEINWLGTHKARSIIHIKGIDNRNLAGKFSNIELLAKIKDLPKLEDDEYYEFQIVDKEVISRDGENLGKVESIIYTGGTDILVLSENKLVPFCRDYIIEITDKYIKLELVDFNKSDIS
ncbi:MAG: ribosome maturation factor RimM [bacterium]